MRDSGATNQQTAVNRRDFVRAAGAMAAALTLEGFKETASADDGRSDGRRSNDRRDDRSEEHTSELQSPCNLVCRLLLEKKKKKTIEARYRRRKSTRYES